MPALLTADELAEQIEAEFGIYYESRRYREWAKRHPEFEAKAVKRKSARVVLFSYTATVRWLRSTNRLERKRISRIR